MSFLVQYARLGSALWVKFDSRPGLPCRNGLRVSQEILTVGWQDFKNAGHLKFSLESYIVEPELP